jgi:LETM1 and EF-hand domain-containing protein 1
MIQEEGIESLSESELRAACRERGMLGLLSMEQMRQQVIFIHNIVLPNFMVGPLTSLNYVI